MNIKETLSKKLSLFFLVLKLCDKIFVSEGGCKTASISRHQKLPTSQTEPVPASYEMDPLLAKAEPINDIRSISVIKYLRIKNMVQQL